MFGAYAARAVLSMPYGVSRFHDMARHRAKIPYLMELSPNNQVSFPKPNYIIKDKFLYEFYGSMTSILLWPVAIPYLEYSSRSYQKMYDEVNNKHH